MQAIVKPYSGSRSPVQINKFFSSLKKKAMRFSLTDEQLIILAGKDLEGAALSWHNEYGEASGVILNNFEDFKNDLTTQFLGDYDINSLIFEYLNVKQIKRVIAYNKKVSQLRLEIPIKLLTEEAQVSAYLNGLKKPIQQELRIKRSTSLLEA